LPLEEAQELPFWKYFRCKKSPRIMWGEGLLRYMNNDQVVAIVSDLLRTVKQGDHRDHLQELLNEMRGDGPIPLPVGPLADYDRNGAIDKRRKYGPGGEGRDHRELKEWLAQHPEELGYDDVVLPANVERPFICGDVADFVWKRRDGRHVVVEVETTNPEPGAHQALKYGCLLCAEQARPVGSPEVDMWIVAWSIPEHVRDFCREYGIRYKEVRLRRA